MAKKAAPTKAKSGGRSGMSDAHKAALAQGREHGRAVRRYLEALERHKPKRGRKRTRDSVESRLRAVEDQLAVAAPLERLLLIQERNDLQTELETMDAGGGEDMQALEDAFVEVAADYGARRGITYSAWREAGVAPAVLRRAGIGRSA